MSRGQPRRGILLWKHGLDYCSVRSGCAVVLRGRWVLRCAGTHGKTTTSSCLAWILRFIAGLNPGYSLAVWWRKNLTSHADLGGPRFL